MLPILPHLWNIGFKGWSCVSVPLRQALYWLGSFSILHFSLSSEFLDPFLLTNGATHLEILIIDFFVCFFSNENSKAIGKSHSWNMTHPNPTQAPAFTVCFLLFMILWKVLETLMGQQEEAGHRTWPCDYLTPATSCFSLLLSIFRQRTHSVTDTHCHDVLPNHPGPQSQRLMAGASVTVSPNTSFILLSCFHDTSCHSNGESTGTLHNCKWLTVALVSISSQQLTLDSQVILLCPSPPPPSRAVTNPCRRAVKKPAEFVPSDIAKRVCSKSTEYYP